MHGVCLYRPAVCGSDEITASTNADCFEHGNQCAQPGAPPWFEVSAGTLASAVGGFGSTRVAAGQTMSVPRERSGRADHLDIRCAEDAVHTQALAIAALAALAALAGCSKREPSSSPPSAPAADAASSAAAPPCPPEAPVRIDKVAIAASGPASGNTATVQAAPTRARSAPTPAVCAGP